MPREVLIEFTKGRRKGQQGVVSSAAVAKKMEGAKILAFHPTGEPYKESQDTKTAEREARPVAADIEAAKKVGDS